MLASGLAARSKLALYGNIPDRWSIGWSLVHHEQTLGSYNVGGVLGVTPHGIATDSQGL